MATEPPQKSLFETVPLTSEQRNSVSPMSLPSTTALRFGKHAAGGGGVVTLHEVGVEVTGPLNTCCGAETSLVHCECACVVQFDTHRDVAQSLLHAVVQATLQFCP